MSDIVERLLRFRPVYGWPEETSTVVEKSLNQVAVDEIIRLRADLAAVTAERDALAARLATVEDEKLVEIVAREIAFAQGAVESPNSEFMDENWHCWELEARAAISAIRPHIEAAERERVENEKLREALRPFGEALKDNYSMQVDELPIIAGSNQMDIRFKWTLGDLRRARAAIKGVTENKS